MQTFPKILGRHYFAIFILASATLSYQILITRFFSVMLYYHFAFAAISLAMLGLTRGAMEVYNNPERYAPERVGPEFARHASWFALSGVGIGKSFTKRIVVLEVNRLDFFLCCTVFILGVQFNVLQFLQLLQRRAILALGRLRVFGS